MGNEVFEKFYKYGSVVVYKFDGIFYFYGDMAKYGHRAILHNARAIKEGIEDYKATIGFMENDDFPTFYDGFDIVRVNEERKRLDYALFKFNGDGSIEVVYDKEPKTCYKKPLKEVTVD